MTKRRKGRHSTRAQQLQRLRRQDRPARLSDLSTARAPGIVGRLNAPTDNERSRLAREARRVDLQTGSYEDWQLAQVVEQAIQTRDQQWAAMVQEQLLKFFSLIFRLETKISEIQGHVLRPGPLAYPDENGRPHFPYDLEDAGALGDLYIQIGGKAEELGLGPTEYPNPVAIIIGIKNLVNGFDDGESLRQAVTEYKGMTPTFSDWLQVIPPEGRPTDRVVDQITAYIANQWQLARGDWQENSRLYNALVEHFDNTPEVGAHVRGATMESIRLAYRRRYG